MAAPTHRAQQRVVAHLDVEPARKGGAGLPPSAMARQWITSSRRLVRLALGPTASNRSVKDPPLASRSVAEEPTRPQNQRYSHACGRKICQLSSILAVHAATNLSAHRASANGRRALYRDHEVGVASVVLSTTNPRGTSSETSNPCMALIPCPNQSQSGGLDFIKSRVRATFPRRITGRPGTSTSNASPSSTRCMPDSTLAVSSASSRSDGVPAGRANKRPSPPRKRDAGPSDQPFSVPAILAFAPLATRGMLRRIMSVCRRGRYPHAEAHAILTEPLALTSKWAPHRSRAHRPRSRSRAAPQAAAGSRLCRARWRSRR